MTTEQIRAAAEEIIDIAMRDRLQCPHRDTIVAIISKHLQASVPDSGVEADWFKDKEIKRLTEERNQLAQQGAALWDGVQAVRQEIEAACNNALLDVYELSIANAPVDVKYARETAECVARQVGKIRAALESTTPATTQGNKGDDHAEV